MTVEQMKRILNTTRSIDYFEIFGNGPDSHTGGNERPSCNHGKGIASAENDRVRDTLFAWSRIAHCFENMVVPKEKQIGGGFQYSHVMRMRPDWAYLEPLPMSAVAKVGAVPTVYIPYYHANHELKPGGVVQCPDPPWQWKCTTSSRELGEEYSPVLRILMGCSSKYTDMRREVDAHCVYKTVQGRRRCLIRARKSTPIIRKCPVKCPGGRPPIIFGLRHVLLPRLPSRQLTGCARICNALSPSWIMDTGRNG